MIWRWLAVLMLLVLAYFFVQGGVCDIWIAGSQTKLKFNPESYAFWGLVYLGVAIVLFGGSLVLSFLNVRKVQKGKK